MNLNGFLGWLALLIVVVLMTVAMPNVAQRVVSVPSYAQDTTAVLSAVTSIFSWILYGHSLAKLRDGRTRFPRLPVWRDFVWTTVLVVSASFALTGFYAALHIAIRKL